MVCFCKNFENIISVAAMLKRVHLPLVYIHMYAAYDIRRPICDSEFFPPSHLCLVVYMCPTPICDIRRPMCDSDFFDLGPKKSDDK